MDREKKLRLNFREFCNVLVLPVCVNLVHKPLAGDRLLSPTSGHFSFYTTTDQQRLNRLSSCTCNTSLESEMYASLAVYRRSPALCLRASSCALNILICSPEFQDTHTIFLLCIDDGHIIFIFLFFVNKAFSALYGITF